MANTSPVLNQRRAGILLHITSLPSTLGLGSLGKHAYRFVDFLKECDLSVWQMLPIHPLHRVPLHTPHRDFLSPYQPLSVHAGNPMLINLQKLIDRGWLPRMPLSIYSVDQIEKAFEYRHKCLKDACFHFSRQATQTDREAYNRFVEENKEWLDDYALFCALKEFYQGDCWWNWSDESHRHHNSDALNEFRQRSKDKEYCLERYYFEQFAFFTQWQELKEYANDNSVYLFGDMPFFVAHDSADVWAHQEYFWLGLQGNPRFLAGVPPPPEDDHFHPKEGQCWGYPLYNWKKLEDDKFQWWLKRFHTTNHLFDIVRLTHFRGFHQCWAIHNTTTGSPKPRDGEWQPVPGEALFVKLREKNLPLNIVAEDIGVPEEVIKLRNQFKFAGIKSLQIAFDVTREAPLKNYHLPHYYLPRDIAYTGTHDSDTIVGWCTRVKEDEKTRDHVCEYLDTTPAKMHESLIQAAFQSCAKIAIIPMQDVLGLGSECRMNTPGTLTNENWRWQFSWSLVNLTINPKLRELVERYERK